MKQVDLIINALLSAERPIKGVVYPAGYFFHIGQALAAARDFKSVMEQAKESLDLAQSLLEGSQHHQQILYAYLALQHTLSGVDS
jgi:hypothetical protein